MENFKNEFIDELLRAGFKPEEAVRALTALAITMQGYTITPKEANLVEYSGINATEKLIKLYVNCKLVEGCSSSFCNNLRIILPKLYEYAGKDVQSITSFDIRGFLASWKEERGVSNSTLDKYRQHINSFYEWLASEGYTGGNPCRSIKKIKQEQKDRESLTQMELEQIRSKIETPLERMIIEVLYSTGCRISEFTGMKLTDIKWQGDRSVVHVVGKGNKHRDLPLNARAQIAIKDYLATRNIKSEYLCAKDAPITKVSTSYVRKIINELEQRTKDTVPHHLHPHLFRHTTATIALNNGMPVQEVQQLLGHAKLDTTMIYAKSDKTKMFTDHLRTVV